jgi:hypothetical protein
MKKAAAIFATIYLLGSVLTFGHQGARFTRECDHFPGVPAFMAGLGWPLYWPYRLSWDAFNPPRATPCPAP